MQYTPPIPANEMERLLNLSEFDIDYSNLENNFKDLIYLAAKIAETDISLINLIDSYTQWTVSNYGLDIEQMPREDSVCQYTILEDDHFEVEDLSSDDRFLDKDYVKNPLNLRYYFGIPLKTSKGFNLGALCVMDSGLKKLSPKKIESLKLIANEILLRLNSIKLMHDLKSRLNDAEDNQKKVAHDIRGPLSGIIGITEIINDQGEENDIKQVLEYVNMIHKSSNSMLDLTDEILNTQKTTVSKLSEDNFNLLIFKEKLEKLYGLQAKNKNIKLYVDVNPEDEEISISKDKLLQIVGNVISNAIKFTPSFGSIKVNLSLVIQENKKILNIKIADTGIGLDNKSIENILAGSSESGDGTSGEKGYGLGLPMVKNLINSLNGEMKINSEINIGTTFEIQLLVK